MSTVCLQLLCAECDGELIKREAVNDKGLFKDGGVCRVAGVCLWVSCGGGDKGSIGGESMWHMSPTTCLFTLRALSLIHTEKHTLQNSPVNIGQGKPDRIGWLWSIIKCGDPLLKLCAKFGRACLHFVWVGGWVSMCSIGQVSSWPPYAELGAQAGSICRVNTQPQPQAAGPYKPHYSSRNHAGTHTHTQTYVVRDGHPW